MIKKLLLRLIERIKNPLLRSIVDYILEFRLELFCGLTAILLTLVFTFGSQFYFLIFVTSLVLTLFVLFIPRRIYKKFPRWICLIFLLVLTWIDYFVITTLMNNIENLSRNGDVISIILIIGYLYLIGFFLLNLTRDIWNLIKKIKWNWVKRMTTFVEKLMNPIYLFPIKLITYSIYYLIKLIIYLLIEFIKIIIDLICYPFKSLKNFLKSLFIVGLILYVAASMFVIVDYVNTHYGYYQKFLCSAGTSQKLKKSVVRIVGSYSEGTGFFITNNQVLTNFHVINGESSPKIIFPNGSFITPTKIVGDKKSDLAILHTDFIYPDIVLPLQDTLDLKDEEPVIATGYAMGTELTGKATVMKGNYTDFRKSKLDKVGYLQTNISLVEGMSGGPLTDQCGAVVGINTQGLAGLSLFISGSETKKLISEFTEQDIKKIKVDPKKSPEDAVTAFYTYLSARKMSDGFNLLSKEYLQKTNFEEWTNRFTDILNVEIFVSKADEKNKNLVHVKFGTENWVDNESELHLYEGTWETILEDGVYKMLKSNIKEVTDPDYGWFYE